MKLYTEEEVRKAISEARFLNQQIMPNESIIDRLSSIELPSDEEIENAAINLEPYLTRRAFRSGAKWMKKLIQGGNK